MQGVTNAEDSDVDVRCQEGRESRELAWRLDQLPGHEAAHPQRVKGPPVDRDGPPWAEQAQGESRFARAEMAGAERRSPAPNR